VRFSNCWWFGLYFSSYPSITNFYQSTH